MYNVYIIRYFLKILSVFCLFVVLFMLILFGVMVFFIKIEVIIGEIIIIVFVEEYYDSVNKKVVIFVLILGE